MSDVTTTTDEAGPRPTRRRSELTTAARWGVAAVLLLGAAASWWFEVEPTGLPAMNRVWAMAVVILTGLAATRARRWSLVVAATGATFLTSGVVLVLAAAAAVVVWLLAVRDERNRVAGAAAGVAVGLASLQLSDLGVGRLSSLLGALLLAVVAVSGYRNSARRARRAVRTASAVVLAVVVLGVIAGGIGALVVRNDLADAVELVEQGTAELEAGDDIASARSFDAATVRFTRAEGVLGGPAGLLARSFPAVGPNYEVLLNATRSGVELSAAASQVAASVDYDALARVGGGIDLAELEALGGPVDEVLTQLVAADDRLRSSRSPWLVPPVSSRLDRLLKEVAALRDESEVAGAAVEQAPALLGAEQPRRYLVLLGNPAELRDVGGHIGNWAELIVDDGEIDLVQVGDPADLSLPGVDNELSQRPGGPPESMMLLQPALFPQNWGGSPDFGVVADLSAELFERSTGRPVDGVVYLDPVAFAALLQVTGPVQIPTLGRTLSAEQAVEFLTRGQYTAFPDEATGNTAVRALVEDTFERFVSSTLPGPRRLSQLLAPAVREGRLRLITRSEADDELLGRLGLDGRLRVASGEDVLAVVNRNANPSKIDAYLHQEVDYSVVWDPEDGSVNSTVAVELRNDAPNTGLSDLVIGNSHGLANGTNRTDLAVITPFQLGTVTVDGAEVAVTPTLEGALYRYTVRVPVDAGAEIEVRFELRGDVTVGKLYRLTLVDQPTLDRTESTVRVTSPASDVRGVAPATSEGAAGTASVNGGLHVLEFLAG